MSCGRKSYEMLDAYGPGLLLLPAQTHGITLTPCFLVCGMIEVTLHTRQLTIMDGYGKGSPLHILVCPLPTSR